MGEGVINILQVKFLYLLNNLGMMMQATKPGPD
jgi:hypothetical protein